MPSLVCFGNLTLDDVVTPDGAVHARCIGGDALYGVLAARLFEPASEMVAPVGSDFPDALRARFGAAGLGAAGVPARACPTLHARFEYRSADERVGTLLSDPADFGVLSPAPADVPEPYWDAGAFVILAMALPAQKALIEACRRRGSGLVALDPQEEYIAGNERAVLELVSGADIFLPSLAEVRLLLGHADALRAARHFASHGPPVVVIKMGASGCLVYDAVTGSHFVQPAFAAAAVDTTGAGDAFCGGFMASLIQEPGLLRKAACRGAVAASFAISAFGAEGLFSATREEAARRLRALG